MISTIKISTISTKSLLLKWAMNIYFTCNNQCYRKVDGVVMWSFLGPILANIFLVKLENGLLKNILNKRYYYCRYVDDTLITCDECIDKYELSNCFNNVHPAIIFTREEENDNSIALLRVPLYRRVDGSIKRNILPKNTWTGPYTHFHNFTPLQHNKFG